MPDRSGAKRNRAAEAHGGGAVPTRAICIAAVVLGAACSCARAGRAAATVAVSARVDSFAEWSASEFTTSVSTFSSGRSLRIAKTLTLLANTDVSLTVTPDVAGGVLTAANGEHLPTAHTLTGDVEPLEPRAHPGAADVYRLGHVPGRGAYEVTLCVDARLPAGESLRSARCTAGVRNIPRGSRRIDAAFEVHTSAHDSRETTAYHCGFSITATW